MALTTKDVQNDLHDAVGQINTILAGIVMRLNELEKKKETKNGK